MWLWVASTGVNMHGGGRSPGYTPIADDDGGVIEARPEYYGLLLFTLAGPGTLLETQLAAGTVDATAYAVRTASGGLNLIVVNKDTLQNLTLTIATNQNIQSATVQTMTGASLAATSGVTIQGATVNPDGTFFPASRRHADAGGYADDLLHPRTDRGADQHHLIRLGTHGRRCLRGSFCCRVFLGIQGCVLWEIFWTLRATSPRFVWEEFSHLARMA